MGEVSARGRQDGDYEAPILTEPVGGDIPEWDDPDEENAGPMPAQLQPPGTQTPAPSPKPPAVPARADLRHLPGKHPQQSHGHGGSDGGSSGGSDGMPASIVSRTVRLGGGTATIERRPGGNPRLTIGDRTVELSTGGRGSELERFRGLAIRAQYDDDDHSGPDGVFRLSRLTTVEGRPVTEILVSLRPVPGSLVTEDGHRVSSYEEAPDGVEVYVAEFDLVLSEGNDSNFDDEPSTRVALADINPGNHRGIYETMLAAAAAERVDGGYGPIDVFVPRAGRVGFRMKGDNGEPVEVEFNSRDTRRIKDAVDTVTEDPGTVELDTAAGPVEVTYTESGSLSISPPSGGPWGIAATGDGVQDLLHAFTANGEAAGIFD